MLVANLLLDASSDAKFNAIESQPSGLGEPRVSSTLRRRTTSAAPSKSSARRATAAER